MFFSAGCPRLSLKLSCSTIGTATRDDPTDCVDYCDAEWTCTNGEENYSKVYILSIMISRVHNILIRDCVKLALLQVQKTIWAAKRLLNM